MTHPSFGNCSEADFKRIAAMPPGPDKNKAIAEIKKASCPSSRVVNAEPGSVKEASLLNALIGLKEGLQPSPGSYCVSPFP